MQAFLDRQLNFPGIAGVCEAVLAKMTGSQLPGIPEHSLRGLDDVLAADAESRRLARTFIPVVHARERGAHA